MTTPLPLMTETEAARRAAPLEDAGVGALETTRGNLPLDTVEVRAAITGLTSRVELTQGFRNPFDQPLEATYIFPLPDRAAVTSLRMEADDRVIEGVLKERGEARADYEQAVHEGKRASIAEEERPGVFTMRVGNILPGERVSVHLTLAGPLPYEDGEATFRFPLVVAPRYIPGTPLPGTSVGEGMAPDTDAVPDASRITPPVLLPGFPNPVRLSIDVDIDPAGLPLAEVRSSLHSVKTDDDAGRLRIRLEEGERANRDFVLRLRVGDPEAVTSSLVVAAGTETDPKEPSGDDVPEPSPMGSERDASEGEGTFAVTVLPPTGVVPVRPRDLVLVLDRSGSMRGWKMVAARRAAARIVDTLTEADRFAVLAFDNHIETPPGLPTGLTAADDRHRFRAVEHLSGLEARGGTEMLAPLLDGADLLTGEHSEGSERGEGSERERTLVLVTDGQVGNEDQILGGLAGRLGGTRIHTVGIDVAVNRAFLDRLAMLGGGRCELVESEDRLDEAMAAIHRRIGTPLVTDLRLEPHGLPLIEDTTTPARLPDLFAGAPVVIMGRFRGRPDGSSVTVSGRAAGGSEWKATLIATRSAGSGLSPTWARAHLRDLEDRYVVGAVGAPGLAELERRIVATSLRFGVLCRFTAFVAVDTRVVTEGGTPHRVTQPVEMPQGWEMPQPPTPGGSAMGTVGGRGMATVAAAAPMPAEAPSPGAAIQAAGRFAAEVTDRAGRGRPGRREGRAGGADRPEAASPELVALQAELAEELRRLHAAESASPDERARHLSELAERLHDLVRRLDQAGVNELAVRPLRELAAELARPLASLVTGPTVGRVAGPINGPVADSAELDRRWLRALDVLEAYARGAAARVAPPPGDRPATGDRSRSFWKRA